MTAALEDIEELGSVFGVAVQPHVHLVPADACLLVALIEDLFAVHHFKFVNLLLVGAVVDVGAVLM